MPAVAVSALGEASVKHRTYIRVDAYFEIDLDVPSPHVVNGHCPYDRWSTNQWGYPTESANHDDWVYGPGGDALKTYFDNAETVRREVEEAIRLRLSPVGFDGLGEGRFNNVGVQVNLPLPTNAKVRPSFGQDDEHRRISEAHWEKQRLDAKEKDEAQVKA